uniref:Uncharacterized protein n=1 Tax=Magallana gigas TaxID=29159 RepID=K1RYL9_MAGGI
MPHSGIRHQHTKHAPTNIGRETLVNPRDIWVLGYSPIIISAIQCSGEKWYLARTGRTTVVFDLCG